MSVSSDREKEEEGKKCLEEDEEEVQVPRHPTPPDGGWGWWVVLASFTCNVIVDGVCMSYGVVAMEYEKVFNAPHSLVWWVGSSLAGCYLLVGEYCLCCWLLLSLLMSYFYSLVFLTIFLLIIETEWKMGYCIVQ